MEQLDFFTIPSPCIGVCQSDERGFCKGCKRTRDERFNWLTMSDDQKRNVIRLCRQRYLRELRKKRASVEDNQVSETENRQQSLF